MAIEDAIYSRGSTFAGLTALLGTNPTRLYPAEAPQTVGMPYVVYHKVSGPRVHVMTKDTLAQPRFQFDCFGNDRTQTQNVRDQVIACFDRWAGVFSGVTIKASVIDSDGVDVERDDTTLIPRAVVDVEITYVL